MGSKWTRYKELSWSDPETGLILDFSEIIGVEGWFGDADELFKKGLDELQRIERGEKVNTDEDRMVGHYWLRAPELAPTQEITDAITSELSRIQEFAKKIHGEKFSHLIQVGIGGSALGPQLLADALTYNGEPLTFWSLDNTDPDGIWTTLNEIPALKETLVLVVSKSGGTKETRNAMLLVEKAFSERGLSFAEHAVAVTGDGSALFQRAQEEQWRDIFPMWDWVGGRTSLWSAVGLLPAALVGIDVDSLLEGARKVDTFGREEVLRNNPAAMLALAWFHLAKTKDMVVLPYKDRLLLLSRYLQQLVMESLGKELDRSGQVVEQGLAVYGNKGSTDQHAYVQQLREGLHNFFALFIEVQRDFSSLPQDDAAATISSELFAKEVEAGATAGDYLSGFYLGTRQALAEKGRSSISITIPELSAYTLGMLIALFEKAVSFYAAYADINAYHQPGVEAGKKAAGEVLQLQEKVFEALRAASQPLTVEEIGREIKSDELVHIFKILERHTALAKVGKTSGQSQFDAQYAIISS